MRKLFLTVLATVISGCATQPKPLPAPVPSCDYKVAGKCKQSSAADISGNTTLGHREDEDLPLKAAPPQR